MNIKVQTSIRLAFEGRDSIDLNLYASFVGAKEEYRQRLHYTFSTGDIIGCDETYIVYSPECEGADETDEVPAEIAEALEATIPQGIQVILELLAKRNLQPIKPLSLDETSV